ncbi:conjugative transposon protein TraM [Salmonirosea aquatica]|uniref:Conjugative transposon protein TraM n=1 Tax=Salmonirosea aquatica TaxID=2654236 RepID=A0A7C9BLZ3_9BACT|nr:conjugative transposon protein TraM [Cytophagaceae bacterium SJW1-29]
MTGKRKKRDAELQDDAFDDTASEWEQSDSPTPPFDDEGQASSLNGFEDDFDESGFPGENEEEHSSSDKWHEEGILDEEIADEEVIDEKSFLEEDEEEEFLDDEEPEENVPNARANIPKSAKPKRVILALGVGLIAVAAIVFMIWKMTVSSNGFRAAQMAPVPAEPIDVAEKERPQNTQPTDYADDEQMRTMNYDNVNSIYGLALKQQEENRKNPKGTDSIRQDASVQQELNRSQQLARQPRSRNTSTSQTPPPRRSQEEYSTADDPFRNKVRDEYLMRAGFNTVKAEGEKGSGATSGNQYEASDMSVAGHSQVETNDPIPGVVSGDQTISNGSRVMFRTLANAMIRGRFAPKGSILVGFAQVNNSRALFNITTLRLLATGEAVPIRMRALDIDMNEGLAVQSEKPARQQVDQVTNSALNQAAGQAAWSAGYSVNRATQIQGAGNALATLGAGLASAATTGRRREVRQKLQLQDGFKVFFIPVK